MAVVVVAVCEEERGVKELSQFMCTSQERKVAVAKAKEKEEEGRAG